MLSRIHIIAVYKKRRFLVELLFPAFIAHRVLPFRRLPSVVLDALPLEFFDVVGDS